MIDDLRTWLIDNGTVHLRTSEEALDWLSIHQDDEIGQLWLDHDLGLMDTILPVVTYIEQMCADGTPLKITEIVVHSGNPSAAERIVKNNLLQEHYTVTRSTDTKWRWEPWPT